MKKTGNIIIIENRENILDFLEDKSLSLFDYVNNSVGSSFFLIRKYITHSDLPTFGKRVDKEQPLSKNILYYLSDEQMQEVQEQQKKEFEVAKQSNIFMPAVFYEKLGIEQLQRRQGQQEKNHQHILINEYANVYLVNDSLNYFNIDETFKVFDKLGKVVNWNKEDFLISKPQEEFTSIELRHAIHGIGTSHDEIFHKLRRSVFKNDALVVLIETKPDGSNNLFLLLDKNARFFTIINETNDAWEKYQVKTKQMAEYTSEQLMQDEKTRKFQNKWKNSLAEEMMNFTTVEGNVFCPFTYIESAFDEAGTLYRASHIKAYEACSVDEAFDINNGLLLVSNADALFDKHLITVSKDKELIFSFLLDHDNLLKQKLLLNQPIFKMVLNDNRMKYLDEHRAKFYEKEEKRKK